MASPQAEAMKELIRSQVTDAIYRDAPPTLEEMREGGEGFALLTGEPESVTWTPVDAGGIPGLWCDADGGVRDRVVQYVHGGGYVIGSIESYRKLGGHLARALGCRVLLVEYGLAPENPHPGPVNDSVQVYKWLLGQGLPPEHLAISGDSAGGGLTLGTLLKLKADGLPQPVAAVPISPWADLEGIGASMTINADKDLIVQAEGLKGMADLFLNGADPRDPLAAPIYGDYHGVCPLYIQVGGDETLLDDTQRVAEAARRDGVEVQVDVFPEMQHVFQMMAGNVPEADDAVARIGAWLRPRLGLA